MRCEVKRVRGRFYLQVAPRIKVDHEAGDDGNDNDSHNHTVHEFEIIRYVGEPDPKHAVRVRDDVEYLHGTRLSLRRSWRRKGLQQRQGPNLAKHCADSVQRLHDWPRAGQTSGK